MAGILDLLLGSTVTRQVPTTIYPHELPTLPAGVVGDQPEPLSTEPIETTRTISTRRPPALLTFLADFAAGFGRGGAMPGIQARLQSQQADLDRQMAEIERKRKLEEQRFKENEPRLLNVGGELVITNPLAIKNRDLPNAIIRLSKKQLDPLSFKEEIAKYSSLYDIEFTKEEEGELYSEFAAYQAQPKEEKDPGKFFRKLGEITERKGKAKITETEFDKSFDTAKGALESLAPFDKEEQAQVSAAIANAQLKKTVQPLQTLATSIANKRDLAESRREMREFTAANIGNFITLTDDKGIVTGFFNPKTREFLPPPPQAGTGVRKGAEPQATRQRRASLETMASQVRQLESLSSTPEGESAIGPVAGRLSSLKQATVGGTREETLVFQISNNLADQLLRARSGAQINEQEYARLRKLVPDPNMPLKDFKIKLKQFKEDLNKILEGEFGKTIRKSDKSTLDEGAKRLE